MKVRITLHFAYIYINIFFVKHRTLCFFLNDSFCCFCCRCKKYGVCFVAGVSPKLSQFVHRDAKICTTKNQTQKCPKPIPPASLNQHCKNSLLVAMKVVYLCRLEWLVPLLKDSDVNVKVVHLVRDPRSTINSRLNHKSASLDSIK